MKILTIVYSIGLGGTERSAVNYAVGYKRYGCDSRVLVLGQGYERLPELKSADVITVLHDPLLHDLTNTCRQLKLWSPEIIHIHNFQESLLPVIEALKSGDTRVVETNVFSRPSLSDKYGIVDLSLQLSHWGYCKYLLWTRNFRNRPQLALVPNIVNSRNFLTSKVELGIEFREKYNIPSDAFLVGRIGQPHVSKWHRSFIKVIKRTLSENPRIYFVLIGLPTSFLSDVKELPEELLSRIRIISIIHGDEELSSFYHAIDCFAHMSAIGESFGYVLAEAMLFDAYVITLLTPFKDNAQYELLRSYKKGICVTTIDTFIDSLISIASRNHFIEERTQQSQSLINQLFSEEVLIPKMISLYKKIIDQVKIKDEDYTQIVHDQFELWGKRRFYMLFLFRILHYPLILNAFTRIRGKLSFRIFTII